MVEPRAVDDRRWSEETLLGGLGSSARLSLLRAGTAVTFTDGRPLVEQGAAGTHAYLLVDGKVKVSARDANGDTALLGIRVQGDIVGEMAALERTLRSADVVASGLVKARAIGSGELIALSRKYPEIALGLARMTARRLRWANRRRLDFNSQEPRTRVARVLYEVVCGYGKQVDGHWDLGVPLTQAEVASLAGTKLRTAEKELARLNREGVVRSKYRKLIVLDLAELERLALD
ncbi:Crp/Fnr family transcriptional regulator [Labedaea rhizosphaerae]|uniref:CRP-like cAMP-binding protein n=1 Tax=Labedaea rhizosphaerae TaxID=598644 RepID=A0A4R6SNK5_LABRH|nr:Crp/Fnr family transcriptional regulator [Labedaea rhizosphaerae]TDQ04763.1 CRP-like cAMP-binding protein [Labedaea rhizosphaerae]